MSEPTIDQVIEQHRIDIGVDKLHVDVVPGAKPEQVKTELNRISQQFAEYDQLTTQQKMQAHIAYLEDKLGHVRNSATRRFDELLGNESPNEKKMRDAIFKHCDFRSSVNIGFAKQYWSNPSVKIDYRFVRRSK